MTNFQEITLIRTNENEEAICCECRRSITMANTLYATNEKLLERLDRIIDILEKS